MKRGQAGFTLLELLLVVVLLGVAAAVVAPRMAGWTQGFAYRDGVKRLAGAMALARATAIRTGRPVAVRAGEGAETVLVGGETIALGAQGRVEALGMLGGVGQEGPAEIHFYPDGSADAGVIQLSGPLGPVTLAVHPITGKVLVDWGKND